MSTKEELTESINNLLGLDLESLGKMSKKDLKALYSSLSKRSRSTTDLDKDFFSRPLKEILNKRILNKPLGDLSLKELLETLFPNLLANREGGGIFGFGILSSLRKTLESQAKPNEKKKPEQETQLEP